MIYSYVTFTGDGAEDEYSFAGITAMFPNTFLSYFSQLDVYVDGVLQTPTTDWTVTDVVTKTITFTTPPANGTTIKIARDTKKDELLHNFTAGSIITASDLNHNTQQIFFIEQELADAQGVSLGLAPAGDKWDFEGKPTYNSSPALVGSGLTTLSQVVALLAGAAVGAFDNVDSFKFTGDGTTTAFDLTGVTSTGLTADAILVQVNGVMQDPDVFSGHTPAGRVGPRSVLWKKYSLNAASFNGLGFSSSPVIVGAVSTLIIHELNEGEVITGFGIDLTTGFTGGAASFKLTLKGHAGNFEDGNPSYEILGSTSDPFNQFGTVFDTTPVVMPKSSAGDAYVEIEGTFGVDADTLVAGGIDVWVRIESADTNEVTSITDVVNDTISNKYSLTYVSGTPRVTFNTAPIDDAVIIVRILSGTFQGQVEDASIGTDQIADDAVTPDKINVGAGLNNRVLVFDTAGDATAEQPSASIIVDFDDAVQLNTLDSLAGPIDAVSMNNQQLQHLSPGTNGTDAVNVDQLNAAVASSSIKKSSGHTIAAVATNYPIAYPSGFTTYPKAVSLYLYNANGDLAYISGDVLFFTDGGAGSTKKFLVPIYGTGYTAETLTVTGTTTGITVRSATNPNWTFDVIWFK